MRNHEPKVRSSESYFRKPLNYKQYHVLLVRAVGKCWTIDSHSWDESCIHHAEREEKRLFPSNKTKIVTSPSDDETVILKIVREMNRFVR